MVERSTEESLAHPERMEMEISRYAAQYMLEALIELSGRAIVDIKSLTFAPVRGSSDLRIAIEGKDAYLVNRLGTFISRVRGIELARKQDPAVVDGIVHDAATLIFDSRQK